MKLAEERGVEANISKTPSFEYWDEMPLQIKIDSMAEYLKDASISDLASVDLCSRLIRRTVQDTSDLRHPQRLPVRHIVHHRYSQCATIHRIPVPGIKGAIRRHLHSREAPKHRIGFFQSSHETRFQLHR